MNEKIAKFKDLIKEELGIQSDSELFEALLLNLITNNPSEKILILAERAGINTL